MDSWLSIFSYLLILVVIVLAAIWWFSRDSQAQTNVQPNETIAVEIVNSDEQATESVMASNQGTSPQAVKPVVEQIKGAEDSKVTDNVIQENEQVISGSPVTLKKPVKLIGATITASVDDKPEQSKLSSLELRFSGSCWINIEDATGKRVAIGTKNKGHLTSVEGVAPFTIKLGKPDVVSIWLDGVKKAVPYSPKGSVANFKLTKE
jgi:cytoskeleton protein RodZ